MFGLGPPVGCFTDRSGRCFFCGSFVFLFCLVFAVFFCARLFVCALWSPAGGGGGGAGLLALVCGVCCGFVTFPLVSWVRCGT